jgi:hypothetical protein
MHIAVQKPLTVLLITFNAISQIPERRPTMPECSCGQTMSHSMPDNGQPLLLGRSGEGSSFRTDNPEE